MAGHHVAMMSEPLDPGAKERQLHSTYRSAETRANPTVIARKSVPVPARLSAYWLGLLVVSASA